MASSGPQFIRPDPTLGQSDTVQRITAGIDRIGKFFQHVENRRFEQARLNQAAQIAKDNNELTKENIALKRLEIEGKNAALKSQNKKDTLHLTIAGELDEEQNAFIDDVDSMTNQALQTYISKASRNLDSKNHGKGAQERITWAEGQLKLLDQNEFRTEIQDSQVMLKDGKAFLTKEELDPRKKYRTRRGPLDETGKASIIYEQADDFTPQARISAFSAIQRAIAEDAGQVQVISGPSPGIAKDAPVATEGEPKGKFDLGFDPKFVPIGGEQQQQQQAAFGISGLSQDPETMEVIFSDPKLTKMFIDAGGKDTGFNEIEIAGETFVTDSNGTLFGFAQLPNGEVQFMQANQIPKAEAIAAPKLTPGNTFKIGKGAVFDNQGFAHYTDTNNVTVKYAQTNVPGIARVVDVFSPGDAFGAGDFLGPIEGEDAIEPTATRGVGLPADVVSATNVSTSDQGVIRRKITFRKGVPVSN